MFCDIMGIVPRSNCRTSLERDGFWDMGIEWRLQCAQSGQLTIGQLLAWASRAPHEVPVVNGEFFFIAQTMGDLDD